MGPTWTMRVGNGVFDVPRATEDSAADQVARGREQFRQACVVALGETEPLGREPLIAAARKRGVKGQSDTLRGWFADFASDPSSGLSHDGSGYRRTPDPALEVNPGQPLRGTLTPTRAYRAEGSGLTPAVKSGGPGKRQGVPSVGRLPQPFRRPTHQPTKGRRMTTTACLAREALPEPVLGPRAPWVLRQPVAGINRRKVLVLLAAWLDAGYDDPAIRQIARRAGLEPLLTFPLVDALEREGWIAVQSGDVRRKEQPLPPAHRPGARVTILTVPELAALLKVPRSSVYAYAAREYDPIPHFRVGKHLRFERAAVEEWIDRQMAVAAETGASVRG
jgi:excisionase family DNA binding protein